MLTIWQHLTQLSFVRTKMYRPIRSDFETRDVVITPTANTHSNTYTHLYYASMLPAITNKGGSLSGNSRKINLKSNMN